MGARSTSGAVMAVWWRCRQMPQCHATRSRPRKLVDFFLYDICGGDECGYSLCAVWKRLLFCSNCLVCNRLLVPDRFCISVSSLILHFSIICSSYIWCFLF